MELVEYNGQIGGVNWSIKWVKMTTHAIGKILLYLWASYERVANGLLQIGVMKYNRL